MSHRRAAAFLTAVVLATPSLAAAQRTLSLSFSTLGLGIATRVNDLAGDGANRVWVATDEGVTAVLGENRAPFFPFRQRDGLLSDSVRAVAFGKVGNDENFFLGFPTGIQHGRVVGTSGLQLGGDLKTGNNDRDSINGLASDGTTVVWAATAGGLVGWNITGQSPRQGDVLLPGASVSHVAAGPTGVVAFSSGGTVFLVPNAQTAFATVAGTVRDLTFDADGNLWASTSNNAIIRFQAGPDRALLSPAVRLDLPRFDVSGFRSPGPLAVDALEGTPWLAAVDTRTARPEGNTYFLAADNTWQQDQGEALFASTSALLADAAGNLWFGTDRGVRARIVRFLVLDQSRYLGEGARATLLLEDLSFAGNGGAPDQASVTVTAGGAPKTLQATEQEGDAGKFSFSFGFSLASDAPDVFLVTSTADGVPIEVAYDFTGTDGVVRTLTATGSWANVEPFEDDLWLGGPCFLRALGR